MKKIILILFILSFNAYSFVITKTESGEDIKWNQGSNEILLYVNENPVSTDVTLDISESQLLTMGLSKSQYIAEKTKQVISDATNQWNQVSSYQIKPVFVGNSLSGSTNINKFYYTNNSASFGSGVIAITSIAYDPDTGDIISSDILMNQSLNKSIQLTVDKEISSKQNAFIGDVITHELGHFLGLSHSEVIDSTMIFSVFKNQHTIHTDDIAGIKHNYNQKIDDEGALSGRIVAGNSQPVFGVNVQVLSSKTNEVVQAQLTNERGEFYIDNLALDDSYYLMVSPVQNLSSLSEYYKNINNQLCFLENFEPSFFTKCGPRDKGRPQLIHLDSSTDYIDLQDITIRCDANLDIDYFANKFKSTSTSYELMNESNMSSTVFYGHFSDDEITAGLAGKGDKFVVDLSSIDSGTKNLDDLTLNLKTNSTGIGSDMELVVKVKRADQLSFTQTNAVTDYTGKKITSLDIDISLSATASDNIFEIEVYPLALTLEESFSIFSSPDTLSRKEKLYTMAVSVGYFENNDFFLLSEFDSYPYEDNSACMDGNVTYTSKPYVPLNLSSDAAQTSNEDNLGITCGTIDIDNDSNSSGSGSFLIGLFLVFFLLNIDLFKQNFLSKY